MGLEGRMVLYRGALKSCNYRCGYCPFSKHPQSERELLKDKEQWIRFCKSLGDRGKRLGIGAVMVVPYGEALIHPWYWEGLGRLARHEFMDAVGAQTNLSFEAKESLALYEGVGGRRQKLRLWATFHPQMTTAEEFAEKCTKLWEAGVHISVGTVGAAENRQAIKELRERLPEQIYLWINKMDGMGRQYTKEEIEEFERVDPYFRRELGRVPASCGACRDRLFVEGDGTLRRCNISRPLPGNWYGPWEHVFGRDHREDAAKDGCGRKVCTCYLAYGGREDVMNRILFGNYPLFRIPRRPKAAFLDIDGLLVPEGETGVPERLAADIRRLAADGCKMFFATSLPYREASKKCRHLWGLFWGGVFAGGAHILLKSDKEEREQFFFLKERVVWELKQRQREGHFRFLVYRDEHGGKIYKITLIRSKHQGWKEREGNKDGIRYFTEGNCLQIVDERACKAEGVKVICRWLGIAPAEAVAAGDSREDEGMMELCR